MTHKNGPKNIGLGSLRHYKFPITALSSILHRASGIFLFILIPVFLWVLSCSLSSAQGFECIRLYLTSGGFSFIVWLFLSAITYHIFAGLRHIFMDFGCAESMCAAKATSVLVLVLGVVCAILWGVWLW